MNTARKLAFWILLTSLPLPLASQARGGDDQAWARAVGEHFRVPPEEVTVLSEWGLSLEEIPVVLFLARRGGMSADALATLRRGGQSWFQLAQRSGLDAQSFQVSIPESASGEPLSSAYAKFRAAGGAGRGVTLDDREVVGLVNLRFLTEYTRTQPIRVLESATGAGSWVLAYRSLVPR